MPRSLTNPLTGQIVWYFAASPPAAAPIAALVVASLAGRPVSLTCSAMTWSGGVVTATVPSQNDRVGTIYPITVAGVTPAGYNGTYSGTLISPTQITFPLASNPGTVTVQGTVAYNSGYTAGGVPAQFYNLATFDPSTGAITAAAATPFLYGVRLASGAWCTMMRVNEPIPGAWPGMTMAQEYALHDMGPEQRKAQINAWADQERKNAEARELAQHAVSGRFMESANPGPYGGGGGGGGSDDEEDEDPSGEMR